MKEFIKLNKEKHNEEKSKRGKAILIQSQAKCLNVSCNRVIDMTSAQLQSTHRSRKITSKEKGFSYILSHRHSSRGCITITHRGLGPAGTNLLSYHRVQLVEVDKVHRVDNRAAAQATQRGRKFRAAEIERKKYNNPQRPNKDQLRHSRQLRRGEDTPSHQPSQWNSFSGLLLMLKLSSATW